MRALELKVPPPLVALVAVGLAWWCAHMGDAAPSTDRTWQLVLAAALLLQGVVIAMAGVYEFVRVDTTVHPFHPEHTQTVVVRGVYALSRNPMYVGMLLCVAAAVLYLGQPWNVLWCVAFYAYITCFQIQPEERILAQKFGEPYRQYCQQVRRWWGNRH